ncbi:DUF1836 domain-containing protein [Aquibacillus koreensis]|uniref:DUF1836 domain-containing protein n=1 Tax=Aquibacillus koreensis TaxID=279446 RepID=A0A9X3WK04_9BACI|nr:DUF1836 domain-containing protein [Aquibacillus koreensis]MCT2537795.1 DUF1836 domain-containing protein [Aquibacillus koreensis]MDC3421172.1 DUF1836 domain-containing protein [Aquibacillus koreensis]
MKEIDALIEGLGLEKRLTLEDIPNIDLYMDQVTQLFENIYSESKRDPEDKILTKTMINNYSKAKLLFPIKNKKYSKEHLLMISFIYQLKGGLSINDIKAVLDKMNAKFEQDQGGLAEVYNGYLSLHDKNSAGFKENVKTIDNMVNQELDNINDNDQEYFRSLLLITTLVNQSNMYRKLAEKLVDELKEVDEG